MSHKVYLTRRETFSTAHRLHSSHLSEDENRRIFARCNNPNGHGHNYILEVTICGPINEQTGMVMNIADLKRELQVRVLDVVDHKHLDLDVDYFREGNIVSTTENLALFIWTQLKPPLEMNYNVKLHEVKIYETEKNIVVYRDD